MPKILDCLEAAYPTARCSLDYRSPLELLIATILSAQCTDVLVNQVTAELFKKYRSAADYANANLSDLERDISRVNFYRNKAKSLRGACRLIIERFHGQVPRTMEQLVTLPGVARKTANVVLGNAFGLQAGIVVDTHVMRLAQRLGLTKETDREKIEQALLRLVPQREWTVFAHRMIAHGRAVCQAKTPNCAACPIGERLCPSYLRTGAARGALRRTSTESSRRPSARR